VHRLALGQFPPRSLPVHPTQIYASVNAGLIFLVLWFYYPFRRRDGEVFALFLVLYPLARIVEEFIRDDETGQLGTPFTISQWISFGLLAIAAGLWIYLLRRPRGCLLPPQPTAAMSSGRNQ
jgi:phosphatidylglycerol:prolipoprotein diacylglycerol transferase